MSYMCSAGVGRGGFVFYVAEIEKAAQSFCLIKDFVILFHYDFRLTLPSLKVFISLVGLFRPIDPESSHQEKNML